MISDGFTKVREGVTDLLVPDSFCRKGPGTKSGDVFYNRQMEFGRDVSVAFGRETFREGQKILDGLAATGARGLRLANECGVKADFALNDRDMRAAVLIKQNADLNSLGHVQVRCSDLRALLAEERFDYVDIDPFGTPIDFIDPAIQSCSNGGMIAITATDTAPLYGTYPKTCARRYGALSAKSPFAHETGLRILVGYLVREAAKHDRTVEPMLCYHADHYFRCYVRIRNGAARADACLKKMAYASFDSKSLERGISHDRLTERDAGPLWAGPLFSKELLRSMNATGDLGTAARFARMLEVWREEAGTPPCFFGMDELAQRTKLAPPKLVDFIRHLREQGAEGSRTHFDPKGIKTDMSASELLDTYEGFAKRA